MDIYPNKLMSLVLCQPERWFMAILLINISMDTQGPLEI